MAAGVTAFAAAVGVLWPLAVSGRAADAHHGRRRTAGACELPHLDAADAAAGGPGSAAARKLVRLFELRFRGRSPVVLRGLASGRYWRRARQRWARPRLLADHGHLRVWPSDLHRGCGLVGPRPNGSSVRELMRLAAGGCSYVKPSHALAQRLRRDAKVPDLLRSIALHGPSFSIGGRGSVAALHRHEESWLAQVFGRKLWLVGPPGDDLPADSYATPCEHRRAAAWHASGAAEVKVGSVILPLRRCIAEAADIIYLPDRLAHATCGLDAFNVGMGFIGAVDGLPPLHRAAVAGDRAAAVLALTASNLTKDWHQPAGAGLLGPGGLPPFHWAAWAGHVSLLELLEQQGLADWPLPGEGGGGPSALHWAAARGHGAAVHWLVARAGVASGTVEDADGATPLHWAAAAGHVATLAVLLHARASPDARDRSGARPLHWLAGEGHVHILMVLAAARAELSVRDDEGLSPVHAAARFGHSELLAALAARGADLGARGRGGGRTARGRFPLGRGRYRAAGSSMESGRRREGRIHTEKEAALTLDPVRVRADRLLQRAVLRAWFLRTFSAVWQTEVFTYVWYLHELANTFNQVVSEHRRCTPQNSGAVLSGRLLDAV